MLGTTFGGNYLAAAAALAVLEVIEDEGLMANAHTMGLYLREALSSMTELENVRGRGLMIGFDLPDAKAGVRKDLLFNHHIFTGEAKPNTIRLLPPLSLNKHEIDIFLIALKESLL